MSQPEHYEVHDQSGFSYKLTDVIGEGGQGRVWSTNIPHVVIKTLMKDKELVRDPGEISRYQERIKSITTLPVHGLDQFSLPFAVLQDACGYVMRLMGSTAKLSNFMPNRIKPKILDESLTALPDWLEQQLEPIRQASPQQAALVESSLKGLALYAQTGGIRMRLQIVYEMADILSKLHARGLIFGDLSVGNVMLSSKWRKVWFIDVDNLCFQGSGSIVYTPGCCAPEVFRNESGVTQQSDIYAFALLAFELLTMHHPFMSGRLIDEDIDREQLANQGALPWILDPNDRSNALAQNDTLLPYTLNHAIFNLFKQTFGIGRNNAAARPPLWMFKHAIRQAQRHSIVCPHCMMGFTYGENHIEDGKCPFCESELPLVLTLTCARKVLWAHELFDESIVAKTQAASEQEDESLELEPPGQTQSLYQQFDFLNQLTLTLDLLDPDFGHKPNLVNPAKTTATSEPATSPQQPVTEPASSSFNLYEATTSSISSMDNPFGDTYLHIGGASRRVRSTFKLPVPLDPLDALDNLNPTSESKTESETKQAQTQAASLNTPAPAHIAEQIKAGFARTSNLGSGESGSLRSTTATLDTPVAHFKWSDLTLRVSLERSFQGLLEYALVPSNLKELRKDPAKLKLHKPHYEACPNGLEISLEQLEYGVCLRLSGKTPIVLQCRGRESSSSTDMSEHSAANQAQAN